MMTKTATRAKRDAFMRMVLDPLPDAELADPQILRLERRATLRRWRSAFYEVKSAAGLRDFYAYKAYHWRDHLHPDIDWTTSAEYTEMDREADAARVNWVRAVHRMTLVPAPSEKELAWKRKQHRLGGAYISEAEFKRQDAAIAADEARLAREGTAS